MAAAADWVFHCRARREDNGTIEARCAPNDEQLAEISKGNNNDVAKLRSTIANSGGGNFLLVPGSKGTVKFLHQGLATTTHLGGETVLGFVQGNFSSSPFKVLANPSEATLPVDLGRSATRGKTEPAACPTRASFFGAAGPDAFANPPGESEGTLANRPNHLFLHPRIFTKSDGPKSIRAKALAWGPIEHLTEEPQRPR